MVRWPFKTGPVAVALPTAQTPFPGWAAGAASRRLRPAPIRAPTPGGAAA